MKVAFLTNHPAPYRIPFYAEWAKLDDLLVVYDQVSSDRPWTVALEGRGFRYTSTSSRSISYNNHKKDLNFTEKRNFYFSYGILKVLMRERPSVVVTAEMGPRSFFASLYCWWKSVPMILTSEGTLHTEREIDVTRKVLRKYLIARADGFWSNGHDSTALLLGYGARKQPITEGMTGVDTAYFRKAVAEKAATRDAFRAELSLKGVAFLILGTLSGRKGILQLRLAVDLLVKGGLAQPISLIFLGNGEELASTKSWAATLPANIQVVFPGFVQMDGVPQYMAAADYGLMPTLEDCWPLSTLEMLLGGLPQLFSVYNGATAELCDDGVTGYKFCPTETEKFADLLRNSIELPLPRLAPEVIDKYENFYSPKQQAARASESLRVVTKVP